MRILSRYILREHIAPFFFAVFTLTFVLLLNEVSQRFDRLLGKGLGADVILEVVGLSIPYILAMSLPMAVLIAVLYTFNRLAGDNEITAIEASGVSLPRLLLPVVLAACVLAAGMVWFNDRVLPESNHRLQKLLTEIGQKKPTFNLSARKVNEVIPNKLYLQAGRIDQRRSVLRDVDIYDERNPARSRTIYADSAHMAYSSDRTDLFLTLYHGVSQSTDREEPDGFQRIFFRSDVMRVPDVTNVLERGSASDYRGDREMSIGMMRQRRDSARTREVRLRETSRILAVAATRRLLGMEVDTAAPAPVAGRQEEDVSYGTSGERTSASPVRSGVDSATMEERRKVLRRAALFHSVGRVRGDFRSFARDLAGSQATQNRFGVEIHKKYAIPAACVVFVLIGAPIAVRYPLGGVAMVVGVSFAFFCAYYVSLVGGEELADRLILSPFWAMWAPDVLFGTIGAFLVARAVKVG